MLDRTRFSGSMEELPDGFPPRQGNKIVSHAEHCGTSAGNALVYVIDDDSSICEALGSLLRSAGFSVQTFPSAQSFLATKRPDTPSCLVLDVQLPGLSGLDLQRELAKTDVQIPIIFITGHGDVPTSVRAIKAGALEFLTKPFEDEDLLDAIQQAIARDRKARQQRRDIAQPNFDEVVGTSAALRAVLKQVEDIPLLVQHYVDRYAQRMNKSIETIPGEVIEALCRYPWPGNIRELQNFIERAVILTTGTALQPALAELERSTPAASTILGTLEQMERGHIFRPF